MRVKRLNLHIWTAPVYIPPPKPKYIEHELALVPHTASGGIRLCAVPLMGDRVRSDWSGTPRAIIADANLVKITESGKLYKYKNINPALGYKTNAWGQLEER